MEIKMLRNKANKAFSMTELIVCVAIIMIVAALMLPVFQRAKVRATDAVCTQNLHNVWMAVSLYRENQQEHSEVGTVYEMGLPSPEWYFEYMDKQKIKCPLRDDRYVPYNNYMYFPGSPDSNQMAEFWTYATTTYGANTPLFVDLLHLDPDKLLIPAYLHKSISVNVGGSVQTRVRNGQLLNSFDTLDFLTR